MLRTACQLGRRSHPGPQLAEPPRAPCLLCRHLRCPRRRSSWVQLDVDPASVPGVHWQPSGTNLDLETVNHHVNTIRQRLAGSRHTREHVPRQCLGDVGDVVRPRAGALRALHADPAPALACMGSCSGKPLGVPADSALVLKRRLNPAEREALTVGYRNWQYT